MAQTNTQNLQSPNLLDWRIRHNQEQKHHEAVRRQLLAQQHAPLKSAAR